MDVNIGITVPNTYMGHNHINEETFNEYAKTIDTSGYHSAWVLDRIIHNEHPILDPLTMLGYLAAKTQRVKLGSAIILLPLHNPIIFAKATATLDYLSKGRLILGVGLGSIRPEYDASNIPWQTRVTRFNEALRLVKALWSGQPVTHESLIGKLSNGRELPTPIQKPHPPIWFGGSTEKVFQRACKYADGWIAGSGILPDQLKETIARMKNYLTQNNRDPSKFEIAKLIHIHVSKDKDQAKQILEKELVRYYQRPYDVEARAAYGTPQACAERIKSYVQAGAQNIILVTVTPELEQPTTIASEILPTLSKR